MRRIIPISLALAALSTLWAGLWWLTFSTAREQLERFAAQNSDSFHYRLAGHDGGIVAVQLLLRDVRWQTAAGFKIEAPEVTLELMPGWWRHYRIVSAKPVEITLRWPIDRTHRVTAQRLDGILTLHGNGRWATGTATLGDAVLAQLAATSMVPEPLLTAAEAQIRLEQPATPPNSHLETGLGLALAVNDARIMPRLIADIPAQLTALTLNARVLGAPPDWRGLPMVESWRNDGGTIELDGLDFNWGNLGGHVNATLALDKMAQPEGSGTAQLVYDPAAPTPAEAPTFNSVVGTIFGLMGKADAASGKKSVTLPLALQERQLALGMFPVGKVPEIHWGND